MLSQREVESGAAPQHSLRMCELAESPLAMICSHSGVSRAIERYTFYHHVNTDFIDASAAELLCMHHLVCPSDIPGKNIQREAVFP